MSMRMEIKKKSLTLALRNLKRSTSPTPTKRDTKIVTKTSMPNSPMELPTSLLCKIVTKRLNTIMPIISEIQLSYISNSLSNSFKRVILGITMALLITASGVAYNNEALTVIPNR